MGSEEFKVYMILFGTHVFSNHNIQNLIIFVLFLFFFCFVYSSYGQGIVASTVNGEIIFSILICSAGLVLFSHLIGNMQVL